ncbi:glycosyltransferase family 4 protein [Methylacidiphilum kamchatkense]|uniref:glycosyltransferase family 4 protein n=1 Tax=Methylacidiphilum kamchatkense TaxID=431057 RepID=UPI00155A452A|nr:glycosyltransferase family 4 protein [Methylacidiphilum kamchatkense]
MHLVSHPIHYFIPRYRELHQRKDISFTVIYYSLKTTGKLYQKDYGKDINWNVSFLEGYQWIEFPKSSISDLPQFFLNPIRTDILTHLWNEKYDILWIHGYYLITNWIAAFLQRINKRIAFIRTEDVLLHKRKTWRKVVKYFPLKILFSQVYGLYIGEANKKYLEYYGIPKERLYPASHGVDNHYFQLQYENLFPLREKIRKDFGIVENNLPVILFCGRFVEMKCPLLLLEAFHRISPLIPCYLLLVGDGPLREKIKEKIKNDKIKNVIITGFLDQSEIAKAYVAADLFVLPSTNDTWGLVINEAMNFGLPIIASNLVGCAQDLIKENCNGFLFPANDVDKLTECLTSF